MEVSELLCAVSTLTEGELVRAVLAGDGDAGQAWRELVGRARPLLRHTLRGFTRLGKGTLWELDDLEQELYLHLSGAEWRRLRCYQTRPGVHFASWLAAVAYDLLLQKHRARRPQVVPLEEDAVGARGRQPWHETGETPEECCLRRETAVAVQQAVARLRHPPCREIIRRHCYLEETLAEVASDLSLTAPAVRQMYKRNRDELKELLPQDVLVAGG